MTFLYYGTDFILRVLDRVRKAHEFFGACSEIVAAGSSNPFGGVVLGGKVVWNGGLNFVFEGKISLRSHEFEQNFVSLFIFEEFDNLCSIKLGLESIVVVGSFPISTEAFADDARWKLLLTQRPELAENQLRNPLQLPLSKYFKRLLDKIVPELVCYYLLCIQSQHFDQFTFHLLYLLALVLIWNGLQNNFQNADWVFIVNQLHEVWQCLFNKLLVLIVGQHWNKFPQKVVTVRMGSQ